MNCINKKYHPIWENKHYSGSTFFEVMISLKVKYVNIIFQTDYFPFFLNIEHG